MHVYVSLHTCCTAATHFSSTSIEKATRLYVIYGIATCQVFYIFYLLYSRLITAKGLFAAWFQSATQISYHTQQLIMFMKLCEQYLDKLVFIAFSHTVTKTCRYHAMIKYRDKKKFIALLLDHHHHLIPSLAPSLTYGQQCNVHVINISFTWYISVINRIQFSNTCIKNRGGRSRFKRC